MVHLADFNPHSREGSDSLISILDIRHVDFNPHSREGSDMEDRYHSLSESDFNPHSREGSDITGVNTALTRKISIHTPAKGVTAHFHGCIFHILISIHTPAKGVTLRNNLCSQKFSNFNPHSREGSDQHRLCSVPSLQQFQSTLPRRE